MISVRCLVIGVALAATLISSAVAQRTAPTMGRSIATLSQIKLRSRSGAPILLGSRVARGKPTLISVWASWCLPCVAEAPYLNRIRKDLGPEYNFIYVNRRDGNPDAEQPPAAVAGYLASTGMADVDYVTADLRAYHQILGADADEIPEGLVGLPRVYLFDRDGREIYTHLGFRSAEGPQLEQLVKQTIAQ